MEQKLSIGRVVHYVLKNGTHRPAVVVQVWNSDCANLKVDLDGYNDKNEDLPCSRIDPMTAWATSVCPDSTGEKPGTWHWPERV